MRCADCYYLTAPDAEYKLSDAGQCTNLRRIFDLRDLDDKNELIRVMKVYTDPDFFCADFARRRA